MKKTSRFIYLMACTVLMLSLVLASCGTVATPAATVAATEVATTAATTAPATTAPATTAPATTAPSAPAMDTSKAVVLSTYLIGGPAKDYDMVPVSYTHLRAHET